VVKSDASIYFTDPPYGIGKEKEELGFYGVYRLSSDGNLTLLTKEMVRPNGLAFSPDEKKLYVSDSEKGHIRVFRSS
jgi:gluconolactonase